MNDFVGEEQVKVEAGFFKLAPEGTEVTLSTITVGGKKISTSLYNQLDRRKFLSQEGSLVWGRTNYGGISSSTRNIIWSDSNGSLYRDSIYNPRDFGWSDSNGKNTQEVWEESKTLPLIVLGS